MTNKYVLIRNLAILCIVCSLLFWFFPFPPIVWRGVLIALSVIAILNKRSFLPCEKAVLFFVTFNLFHFLVSYLWQTSNTSSIGNILSGLLSLSLFSFLSKKGVMTEKAIAIIGVILVMVSVLCYNYYSSYIHARIASEGDTTNSYSEFFAMLFPILFFIKKPLLKWPLLLVCLFFLIMGAKRGNIIVIIIPLILLLHQTLKDNRQSAIKILFSMAIIVGASVLVYYWASSNEYLLYRLEQTQEGNSSGRDRIYERVWHLWLDSENFFHQIFGYGYEAVYNHLHVAAHNDWLEILVDYGLVGVLLYLIVYVCFVRQIRVTIDPEAKIVIISAVSILFVKSLFSMSFNTSTLPLLMISLGTALGQYKNSQAV